MNLLHLAWVFATNPAVLIVAGVVVATLVGLWFLGGPVLFYKVLTNTKVWLGVAVIAVVLAFSNLTKQVEQAKAAAEAAKSHQQAQTDSDDVVQDNVKKKRARQAQTHRLQEAIDHAKPGDELDSLLDQIAREGGAVDRPPVPVLPDHRPERLRDGPGKILP